MLMSILIVADNDACKGENNVFKVFKLDCFAVVEESENEIIYN